MKSTDFIDAFGGIDEDLIRETDDLRRTRMVREPAWRHLAALAACISLVIIAGTAYGIANRGGGDTVKNDPPASGGTPVQDGEDIPNNDGGTVDIIAQTGAPTSEKYDSLEELLSYLSKHEKHDGDRGKLQDDSDVEIPGRAEQGISGGAGAVIYGGYVYYVNENRLMVSGLEGGAGRDAGLETPVSQLFLAGDRLIALGTGGVEPGLLESEWAMVSILDLTDPEHPAQVSTAEQLGTLTAVYLDGDEFTIITADGQCACGFSRLDDPADYKPKLKLDGREQPWGDDTISILGEPTRVEYAAVTKIDIFTGKIVSQRAIYGEIDDIFYGSGWLVVNNGGRSGPELYTFDTSGQILSTGRIDNSALGGPKKLLNVSVTRKDGIYLVVSELDSGIMVLTADMETGRVSSDIAGLSGSRLNDILWEDDRALVTVQTLDSGKLEYQDRLYIADFSGAEPVFTDTGITGGHVDGIDGLFSYGNPFGGSEIRSIIPMGGGVYLRYGQGGDSFDVYDLSGQGRVACRGAGQLPEDQRYHFIWRVYDGSTLGVLHLEPGSNGRIVRPRMSWRVYSVDPEAAEPMELLAEYDLGEGSGFAPEVTPLESGGRRFVVTPSGVTEIVR